MVMAQFNVIPFLPDLESLPDILQGVHNGDICTFVGENEYLTPINRHKPLVVTSEKQIHIEELLTLLKNPDALILPCDRPKELRKGILIFTDREGISAEIYTVSIAQFKRNPESYKDLCDHLSIHTVKTLNHFGWNASKIGHLFGLKREEEESHAS